MPDLIVRIKKKTNGEAALTCQRADGSITWQRQEGEASRFFPMHDLTHFAVESILGLDAAFFGLIADFARVDVGRAAARTANADSVAGAASRPAPVRRDGPASLV